VLLDLLVCNGRLNVTFCGCLWTTASPQHDANCHSGTSLYFVGCRLRPQPQTSASRGCPSPRHIAYRLSTLHTIRQTMSPAVCAADTAAWGCMPASPTKRVWQLREANLGDQECLQAHCVCVVHMLCTSIPCCAAMYSVYQPNLCHDKLQPIVTN
jgi:hypothetical protein